MTKISCVDLFCGAGGLTHALIKWEALDGVKKVDQMLRGGHRGWRNSRHLDPNEGYPGIRYALLHTLSHLLIRELALECGYNAASIRERIYADTSGDSPQAGIRQGCTKRLAFIE